MKQTQVLIGAVYTAKVSGTIQQVRIERAVASGGWEARNVGTNRAVRIKSARRLRKAVGAPASAAPAPAKAEPPAYRIALQNKQETAEIRRSLAALGAVPSKGHVAWIENGSLNEIYLYTEPTSGSHMMRKAPATAPLDADGYRGGADASVIATGRDGIRDIVHRLTGGSPAKIGLKLRDAAAAEPEPTPPSVETTSTENQDMAATKTKPEKKAKAPKTSDRGPSLLDLAASILKDTEAKGLKCPDIVERAMKRGWTTSGKTPAATLNAALIREIAAKGADSRFQKIGPGLFAVA